MTFTAHLRRRLGLAPRSLQFVFAVFSIVAGVMVALRQDAPYPLFQTAGTVGYALAAMISFGAWFALGREGLAVGGRRLVIGFQLLYLPTQFLFLFAHQVAWIGMLLSAVVAVAMKPRFPRLGKTARKIWLTLHVGLSVGWLGVSLAMLALSIIGVVTADAEVRHAAYHFMEIFNKWLAIPSVFLTLITGVVVALGTPWGLAKHVWVLAKLAIALSIPLLAAFEGAWIEALAAGTRDPRYEPGTTGLMLVAAMGLFFVLLWSAVILSVVKPFGRTRWGRRAVDGRQPRETRVEVAATRTVAADVLAVDLTAADGGELAAWTPGAHIDLVLPSGLQRQYSLCGTPTDRSRYRIAVKNEPDGRGGSAEVHRLTPGTRLALRGPRNHFALVEAPSYRLVAGGVGIVPLLPMIDRLAQGGAPWTLLYRGRSLPAMPFAEELATTHPAHVTISAADQEPRPDLALLLREAPRGTAFYCCGPESMLDTLEDLMPTACPHGSLHIERFAGSSRTDGAPDTGFGVELRRTGRTMDVPADRSLLSVLRDVDPTLDFSCDNGVCGSCELRVLEGVPDHRDDVLQPAERERTDLIYPCVSRTRDRCIVVDI